MLISPKILLNNLQLSLKKTFSKLNIIKFLWITTIGFSLTTIFTWPMLFKLSTLYSDQADYTLVGWIMWYNQLSFTTGRIFSSIDYYNAFQFYPWPYALAFSENLFLPSLIFAPIYWLTNQLVFSVNFYTFCTFILTFISGFYVFKKLIKNSLGSIIAAVIFTFNPMTAAHFPGHTHILGKFFLPVLFLSALNFLAKPNIKNAFLFSLFFTLNALTSINLFIVSIPSLLFSALPFFLFHLYKYNLSYFKSLIFTSLIGMFFLLFFFHFITPYVDFSNLEGAKRSIQESVYYSAQPLDWLLPFPESLLYGDLVRSFDEQRTGFPQVNFSEHTLGLNIVPLILFISGCVAIKKQFRKNWLVFSALLSCLTGTFIFTFGPMYQTTLLPYYYFNSWTGLLDGTRVPTRFQFFFYLPFSLIAGIGFTYLLQYWKKGMMIFLLVLGIITLENFNLWQIMDSTSSLTNNPPVFQQYKSFSFLEDKTTLHIPTYIGPFEKQIYYLNLSTLHRERLMNGYSGYFPPEWSDLLARIDQYPDQKAFDTLKALKVNYLIIHKDQTAKNYAENLKTATFVNDLITFENENYLILNIDKVKTEIKNCLLSDIKIELVPYTSSFGINATYFNRIKISNPKDCYFVNTLNERYLNTIMNIKGNNLPMNLKLPPVLGPKEEIILK